MATNASPDTSAHPTKDEPTCPERDARESAQDDSSTDTDNNGGASQGNPPNHRVPTHGPGRFLWECPEDTPVEELGRLYREWQDATEQADLSGWSE